MRDGSRIFLFIACHIGGPLWLTKRNVLSFCKSRP